jgi:hypothetical protein
MGDRLEMIRIDAASNATNVVEFQPFWNRPPFSFVVDDMSTAHSAINLDATVTVWIDRSEPNETARIGFGHAQSFDSLFHWDTACTHIRLPLR